MQEQEKQICFYQNLYLIHIIWHNIVTQNFMWIGILMDT
jgi:hypothetical protein